MITFGPKGFMIVRKCHRGEEDAPLLNETIDDINTDTVGLYFTTKPNAHIVSASGAGDCLASGFIAALLKRQNVSECATAGLTCASLSLHGLEAVPNSLQPGCLSAAPKLPYALIRVRAEEC